MLRTCRDQKGLVHYIGDEAGTHAPRVTLPSPCIVSGFSGKEPGSAQAEEGVRKEKKTKKRDGAPHPKVSPTSVRGSGPRGSVLPLGPKASSTWPRASHTAARKRGRRGQRSVERAPRKKKRHVWKRCAAGSAR
ncbi:hypothetical protein NDU88_004765 [Pleurodeles waltl]|uniref:Uncharacterized protein n=1 Tax=Pleurodeles waltl TaxID=8319 RepID=A0AAV7T8P2_PLEWA|nr:hypothetical protein NDU88_004765 [Pleurodeles waltl]